MISLIRSDPAMFILMIPIILIALSAHELAHGYVAYKCGDGTAKAMGRLTLDPLKHLDPIGTIMMFVMGFGWAKPVPVNTRNFRKPRRDIALVSIAGAAANLIIALISTLLLFVLGSMFFNPPAAEYGIKFVDLVEIFLKNTPFQYLFFGGTNELVEFFSLMSSIQVLILKFLGMSAVLNTGLAVFNLIPLPPLDGSKVVSSLLPPIIAAKYLRLEFYTRYILLGIFVSSYVLPEVFNYIWLPIEYARTGILTLFQNLVLLIF